MLVIFVQQQQSFLIVVLLTIINFVIIIIPLSLSLALMEAVFHTEDQKINVMIIFHALIYMLSNVILDVAILKNSHFVLLLVLVFLNIIVLKIQFVCLMLVEPALTMHANFHYIRAEMDNVLPLL